MTPLIWTHFLSFSYLSYIVLYILAFFLLPGSRNFWVVYLRLLGNILPHLNITFFQFMQKCLIFKYLLQSLSRIFEILILYQQSSQRILTSLFFSIINSKLKVQKTTFKIIVAQELCLQQRYLTFVFRYLNSIVIYNIILIHTCIFLLNVHIQFLKCRFLLVISYLFKSHFL